MTPHRMQKTYRCENHVTRGAGQGAFTCPKPIQVDVIVDGNVQQVVTILGLVDGQQMFSQFFHFYCSSPGQCAFRQTLQFHR